jgi:hypothetical protein
MLSHVGTIVVRYFLLEKEAAAEELGILTFPFSEANPGAC